MASCRPKIAMGAEWHEKRLSGRRVCTEGLTAILFQELHPATLMKIEETGPDLCCLTSSPRPRCASVAHLCQTATQRLQVNGLNGVKGLRFWAASGSDNRVWRSRATAAGILPVWSARRQARPGGQTVARRLCLSSLKCARPSRLACRRRWEIEGSRQAAVAGRSRDLLDDGRRRRRRMTATRMTTSTTSTSALEETASANGAWNC